MARALIALGSNLGDRQATLDAAIAAVATFPGTRVVATSGWIDSVAVSGPSQPCYRNGASLIETALEPLELLDRLQAVEQAAGRLRNEHWGPRTLDLDLLLYDDAVIESARLRVPHPRLPFRRFVLEPAVEIAADWAHPLFGTTLAGLLEHWETTHPYLAVMGPPRSGKTRLAAEVAARTGARLLLDSVNHSSAGNALRGASVGNALRGVPQQHEDASIGESPKAGQGVPNRADSSASPEAADEIEFLARRSQALAVQSWPADGRWTVSDFWLPQSLAWWSAEHAGRDVERIENEFDRCSSQAVAARFVVALDVEGPSANPGDDFRERLRSAMLRLTRRGTLPPVLWLSTGDWRRTLDETLAILAG